MSKFDIVQDFDVETTIMLGDLLIVVIKNQPKIASIKTFHCNTKPITYCSEENLQNCVVQLQLLVLQNDEDRLVLHGELDPSTFTVEGKDCFAIAPQLSVEDGGSYYFHQNVQHRCLIAFDNGPCNFGS